MKRGAKMKTVTMTVAAAWEAAKVAERDRLNCEEQMLEEAQERFLNQESLLDELFAAAVPDEIESVEIEVPATRKDRWHMLDAADYLRPIIEVLEQRQEGAGEHTESTLLDGLLEFLDPQTY